MEGGCSKDGKICPQLLDLIPKEREWVLKREDSRLSEENKLELRLGPPGEGEEHCSLKHSSNNSEREQSLLSLGYHQPPPHKFSSMEKNLSSSQGSSFLFNQQKQQAKVPPFLHFPPPTAAAAQQSLPIMPMESSQACCTKVAVELQQSSEKMAFSPPANTAVVPNSSQKRTAPGPVVGWPPIRSFRKNLSASSSSSKQQALVVSDNANPNKKVVGSDKNPVETCGKGLFVKINMDGVPIGRKVDIKAYDSYEKLSAVVDELFRGLLAAQRDSSAGDKQEEERAITGVLDGSGEYTLVYEDNEGDRMLVGDVPWHMFASTVKRLRVLKTSEVSALSFGSAKQEKMGLK